MGISQLDSDLRRSEQRSVLRYSDAPGKPAGTGPDLPEDHERSGRFRDLNELKSQPTEGPDGPLLRCTSRWTGNHENAFGSEEARRALGRRRRGSEATRDHDWESGAHFRPMRRVLGSLTSDRHPTRPAESSDRHFERSGPFDTSLEETESYFRQACRENETGKAAAAPEVEHRVGLREFGPSPEETERVRDMVLDRRRADRTTCLC